MLQISEVTKSFGAKIVLKSISCHVEKGQTTALLGQTGSGKTTLLKCINGIYQIDGGTIEVDNVMMSYHPRELSKFRKSIGMVSSQQTLILRLSILENVILGRLTHKPLLQSLLGKFTNNDYDLAYHYLNKVGLYHKRLHRAEQLTDEEQRRVAFARTLVQQPKIILADEPCANLCPKSANTILNLFAKITQEEKICSILATNNFSLALSYSPKIMYLHRGQIIAPHDIDNIPAFECLSPC